MGSFIGLDAVVAGHPKAGWCNSPGVARPYRTPLCQTKGRGLLQDAEQTRVNVTDGCCTRLFS